MGWADCTGDGEEGGYAGGDSGRPEVVLVMVLNSGIGGGGSVSSDSVGGTCGDGGGDSVRADEGLCSGSRDDGGCVRW